MIIPEQELLARLRVQSFRTCQPLLLYGGQPRFDLAGYLLRDVALESQNVGHFSFIIARPYGRVRCAGNELHGDLYSTAGPLDRTLDYAVDTETACDIRKRFVGAFK